MLGSGGMSAVALRASPASHMPLGVCRPGRNVGVCMCSRAECCHYRAWSLLFPVERVTLATLLILLRPFPQCGGRYDAHHALLLSVRLKQLIVSECCTAYDDSCGFLTTVRTTIRTLVFGGPKTMPPRAGPSSLQSGL